MIICIGPVCIPLWGLLPFVLVVLSKCKLWLLRLWYKLTGQPMPEDGNTNTGEGDDANTTEGKLAAGGDTLGGDGLRQRVQSNHKKQHQEQQETQGVRDVTTPDAWAALLDDASQRGQPVVVQFTADWCNPCKAIAPVFDRLCKEHGSTAAFARIKFDGDEMEVTRRGGGGTCATHARTHRRQFGP
eukprot:m.47343 g.47343  ORF g.47343 m.47343 type:complete len:186 (-) comp11913_c0_seq2:2634-3191(-)